MPNSKCTYVYQGLVGKDLEIFGLFKGVFQHSSGYTEVNH